MCSSLRWLAGVIVLIAVWPVQPMAQAADKTPSLSVELDRPTISAGEKATVTWKTKYTKYCMISNGVGLAKRNGSIELSPRKTSTYTITAYGVKWRSSLSDEEKAQNQVQKEFKIKVTDVPPSVIFAPSSLSIYRGDSVTLSWDVANADTIEISPGIGTVPRMGEIDVQPQKTIEYTLTAEGSGGKKEQKFTVKVNERASN